MKKLLFIILMALITPLAMAQPEGNHHSHKQQNPPHQPVPAQQNPQHHHAHNTQHPGQAMYTVSLTAAHGEEFVVYVDGDIVNRKSLSSVLVQNLTPHPHDIYVVLKRPAEKIAMIKHLPTLPVENLMVSYNPVSGILELKFIQPQLPIPQVQPPHVCTFEEVEKMFTALKNESFDETRLSMAKNMVANNKMAAHQIKRLAESFSFDNNKLSFLKYAYDYCIDRQNYYECVDVLSFSSDKEALLRYINN